MKNSIMVAGSLIVLVSCGGFEASQHPDNNFRFGRGLEDSEQFGNHFGSQSGDPRFRAARVTTESSPLRLKTDPRSDAPSPSSGPTSLARGSDVDVYWPLDINNNHVRVHVSGRALWVTYRSSGGQEYVTLLEDIYVPQTNVGSSGSFSLSGSSFGPQVSGGGGTTTGTSVTGGDAFMPSQISRIRMSSTEISRAYMAIRNVSLTAASVPTCSFDPLVGNNAGSNNCYEQVVISRPFRDFVANHGQACAEGAAREAFGFTPTKVLFHSSGAGQVRPDRTVGSSGTLSTHATGQAFDLYAITVFSNNGSRKVTLHRNSVDGSSTTERQNNTFYWSFANCWRGRVRSQAPCASSCGDRVGAMTYTDNSAHHDHLHMSMPMCNRERYDVSCI